MPRSRCVPPLTALLALGCTTPAPPAALGDATDPAGDDTAVPADTEAADAPDTGPLLDTGSAGPPDDTGLDLPGDAWTPSVPPAPLSTTARVALTSDLDDLLDSTSAVAGVLIVDADNGQELFAASRDLPLKPASNTKLFTTGALFDLLGEHHRHPLQAFSATPPTAVGEVDTLYVLVEHDGTWTPLLEPSVDHPAARLAQALYDAGLRQVTTLNVRGEGLVDGYRFGTYDPVFHREEAADVLTDALLDAGVGVTTTTTSPSLTVPAGASLLAERPSLPASVVGHPINDLSHNELADLMVRHLGHRVGFGSSLFDGSGAVLDWLSGAGLPTTGLALYDGSGLSHDNRVTAGSVVALLDFFADHPAGESWRRTLSIAGVSGTLAYRMTGADTSGRFWGKSGTLSGVIATSGILHHPHDGHRYHVSILMNEVDSASTARALHDQMVARLAQDLRGLGPRPDAPVLRTVTTLADGRLQVDWDPVAGADTYEVWWSTHPHVWTRAQARDVGPGHTFLAGDLPDDVPVHVRVVARSGALLSDPSDAYTATPGDTPARVLIVDANDRYATQWENPMGLGHAFAAEVGHALPQVPVQTASHAAVLAGDVALADHEAVIWLFGEESSVDRTFEPAAQAMVDAYRAQGGHLIVSGAEVGWDLVELGDLADQGFYADALQAEYLADDAGAWHAEPVPGGPFDGLGELGFYRPGWIEPAYPDVVGPTDGSQVVLTYPDGADQPAAVLTAAPPHVLTLGFPLSALDDGAHRQALLAATLDHFGL